MLKLSVTDTVNIIVYFSGVLAQRLCDAELRKEINKIWNNLSSKTVDLLVTPHKRKPCI